MGARSDLIVPPVNLDRDLALPLREQLYRHLGNAIRGGSIPAGSRLPSSRMMARLLQVSRNTVFSAYEDLAADGLLQAERGTGMRVSGPAPHRGLTLFGLREVVRAAGFPARVMPISDLDGNALYINVR